MMLEDMQLLKDFVFPFKSGYGSGTGSIICLGVVAVAILFYGMSSIGEQFLVSRKSGGIPSNGFNIYGRTLYCLHISNLLLGDTRQEALHPRPIQPWPLQNPGWLDCCSLGCNHHSSVLPTCCLSSYKRYSELYTCCC